MSGPAAIAIDLLAEAPDPGRKGWVHLLPRGTFDGIDGRGPYVADDPDAIIQASKEIAGQRQMVIDYEHSTDLIPGHPRARGTPVPAAGWIVGLQSREDGIWGLVEWTERAAEHLAKREYRYLSPVIKHDPTGRIGAILRASLTNVPNLDQIKALASAEEGNMTDETRAALIKLLGLDESADDAALIGAVRSLTETKAMQGEAPDPAKWVPIGEFQRAIAEANKLRQGISHHAAEEKVAADIRKGVILPWMKDWAVQLCTSNMSAYENFIGGVGPGFSHLLERTRASDAPPDLQSEGAALSELERQMCANLGITAEHYTATRKTA